MQTPSCLSVRQRMAIVICLLLSVYILTGTPASGLAGTPMPRGEPCTYTTPTVTPPRIATEIQQVRLMEGPNRCSGNLVLTLTTIQTVRVCPQGFSVSEAAVVCRELNCGSLHSIRNGNFFSNLTHKVWEHTVKCHNNETQLKDCHRVTETCNSAGSVGIVCTGGLHELQLRYGPGRCHGDLMLYYGGAWRSVGGAISPDTAEAVCEMLGCGHAVELGIRAAMNPPVVSVKNRMCFLPQPSITNCVEIIQQPNPAGRSLRCAGGDPKAFRLVDGPSSCAGTLEVFQRGCWEPVCASQSLSLTQQTVCQQQECGRSGSGWKGPGPRGRNRTLSTSCVRCQSLGLRMLMDNQTLWDCKEQQIHLKQMNISCPEPPHTTLREDRRGLSGGVTACIVLVVILLLLLFLSYVWKLYKRNGKQVFQRKQTQRQWIGPTGAASHAVSFHRNNNANFRPVSSQSASSNVYTDGPPKDTLSAYPALERRANAPLNLRDNSSDSDYDFFDTHGQRL
ncbi:scavenger receptor cysteine-rich type 1 protein M130-like isoform X2 [Hemiscyllium ocellatum]|uniref:scavenger receptor cysteine-rich type 1 protein M130-like isoform X2 n=1 Tax=Hemiscyllium ocellatum TaxID=170820 RepID=UPI002965EF97|nr:scavenger receptor cysteine-rich type 1 protein M130-like isoform X2 [Hemiscyllium ocellatum]